jgi:hypothetical protein
MSYSVYYTSNEALGSIQECECKYVSLEEATKWFKHHTTNVTAKVGITQRVIMTDGGDCIVAEWQHGKGIIWPKEEEK